MSVKLDQALTEAFIAGAFGLPIVHENDDENTAEPGSKFFELQTFHNPTRPIGVNSSNDTTGVLQFVLAWPLHDGAIEAKKKADEVFAAFPVGRRVSFEGQTLVIGGHHLFRAAPDKDKGRFEVVGRINYAAIVPR